MERTLVYITSLERDPSGDEDYREMDGMERSTPVPREIANAVSSVDASKSGWHLPVLDIDLPVRVVESHTPGHHHLYIDKPVRWDKYEALLVALADAGIIESGYAQASIHRQASFVRAPWALHTKGAKQ